MSGRIKRTREAKDFKIARAALGQARCDVCRWRPPRALRLVAGAMIGRLLHAHHVVPVACGGSDTQDNLILLCPTHHSMAHHLGRMTTAADGPMTWSGPANRRELLACFNMFCRPDEYARLAALEHNYAAYIDMVHSEALPLRSADDVRLGRGHMQVLRGASVRTWGAA